MAEEAQATERQAQEESLGQVTYDRMPGADPVSEEESAPFNEDMSFGLDGEGNPIEEEANEDAEETDAVEETTEEAPEAEEEVVTEEEGEPDGEETTEGAPQEDDAEADGPVPDQLEAAEPVVEEKQKSPMVPKARLDEVLAKQKALQKQLDDQMTKEAEIIAEAPKYDFEAKETAYQEAILDGDTNKANSIRNEIRNAEREQTMFEVQQKMGQTVQQSQELMNLQSAAKELEVAYPILDENSQEFNADLQKEVIELRDAFVVQGYEASDALKKAASYTLAAKAPDVLNPVQDTTTSKEVETKKAVVQKKKKATVQKKIEAAEAQPPELQGEGNAQRGESTLDVNALSEDEFNALPEETLRRLRGDFG